jgi:hypothetical protein
MSLRRVKIHFFVEEESELKEEMGSNHHELESEEEKYEYEDES